MDYEALVQEVLRRVMIKLQELEAGKSCNASVPQPASACCCEASEPVKEKTFKKRVITERNVKDAAVEGAKRIIVCENTIITDLARELAARNRIELIRG